MKIYKFTINNLEYLVTVLLIFVLISGCKKEEEDEKPPPLLPAVSTFVIDFSYFEQIDTTHFREDPTFTNIGAAMTRVLEWNDFIDAGLSIPMSALVEDDKGDYIYDPVTNAWNWSYEFGSGGLVYWAKLQAWLDPAGVQWALFITEEGNYYDFLWVTGIVDANLSDSYWTIYLDPDNWEPFVEVRYKKLGDESFRITYENILYKDDEEGSYIQYLRDDDPDYDLNLELLKKSIDNLTEIKFNSLSSFGKIDDPALFGEEGWHCWDELYRDIDCDSIPQ